LAEDRPRPSTITRAAARVTTLINNDDHGVAAVGNVLVQVRRGVMTLTMADSISGFARAARLLNRGPAAVLAVLEEGAPLSDPEVRKRQGELISAMLADPEGRQAVVIYGEGALASAKRMMVRHVAASRMSQLSLFADVAPAIDWLGSVLGVDTAALRATVSELRRPPGG
jgi:hypothetical protein